MDASQRKRNQRVRRHKRVRKKVSGTREHPRLGVFVPSPVQPRTISLSGFRNLKISLREAVSGEQLAVKM